MILLGFSCSTVEFVFCEYFFSLSFVYVKMLQSHFYPAEMAVFYLLAFQRILSSIQLKALMQL